jgi:hypothetical protein
VRCVQASLITEPSQVFIDDSTAFDFGSPDQRIHFALLLYNFLHILNEEKCDNAEAAIERFKDTLNKHCERFPMKLLSAEDTHSGDEEVRAMELKTHGYEVEPKIIVDDQGIEFKPLFDVRPSLFSNNPLTHTDNSFRQCRLIFLQFFNSQIRERNSLRSMSPRRRMNLRYSK